MATTSFISRFDTVAKYSEMVICNTRGTGTIYLAGQVAEHSVDMDMYQQTSEILGLIDKLLERGRSSKNSILSATIYIVGFDDFAEMNKAWTEWMPIGCAPARATVSVAAVCMRLSFVAS